MPLIPNPTSVKDYSARWGTTFHVLNEALILKILLRVRIREMKNKMLLVFATIILAPASLSCFGYAFLEHCKLFDSRRVWNQTQVKYRWKKQEYGLTGDTNDNTVAWTVVKATVWPWHWGESLQPMSEWLARFGICNVVRVLWHRDNAWYMCRKAHFWWAQRWPWKKDQTAARETLAWFSIGDFNSQ